MTDDGGSLGESIRLVMTAFANRKHLKRELLDEVMSNIFSNTRASTSGRFGAGAGAAAAGKAGGAAGIGAGLGNVGLGGKMRAGSSTEDSILRDAVAAARELGRGIDPDLFEKINESTGAAQHTLLANGRAALGNSRRDMLRIIEALKLTHLLPVAKSHILKEIKQRMKVMVMAHIERYTVNWRKLMSADRGRAAPGDTKPRDALLCSFVQDVFADGLEVLGSVVTTFKAIQQMVLSCTDDEQAESDDGLTSTQCSYLAWADVQSECISVLKEILGISSHETSEYLEVNEAFEELDEESDESTIFSKIGGFFSSNEKEAKQRSKKFKSKLKFSFKSAIDGGAGAGADGLEDASISLQYDSESSYRRLLPHVGLMLAPQLYIHVKNFVKKACARLPQHEGDEGRREIERWLEREVLRLLLPQLERRCRSQIFKELEGSEPFSVSHVKSRVASAFEVRPSFRVVGRLLEIMDELHTHMLMMGLFKKEISQIVVDCHVLVLEAFQEAASRIMDGQRSRELAEVPLIEGLFLAIPSYTSLGLGTAVDLSSVESFSSFGAAIQLMNLVRAERPLKKSRLLSIGGVVQLIYLATSSLRVVQNMEEVGIVRSPQGPGSRAGDLSSFGIVSDGGSDQTTPASSISGAVAGGSGSAEGGGFNPFAPRGGRSSAVFDGLVPVVTQFQSLAGLCLRAARIELQMKVVYHVQSLPALSFSCDELDIDEEDAHTRELAEIFSNVSEELREKTIQPVCEFCLSPLAETLAHEVISILPEIDAVNANGILRMQSIFLSLQQALGGWSWNFAEREGLDAESNESALHFERARRYYELLNLPGHALLLFAREEMDMFTANEYKNLMLANVEEREIAEEQREQLAEILSARSEQSDPRKRTLARKSRRQSFRDWQSVVKVSM